MVSTGWIERPSDEIPEKLGNAEYVRYQGSVYTISKTRTNHAVAEYTLSLDSTEQNDVEDSQPASYADLSKDGQDVFKQALNGGSYSVRGTTLPDELSEFSDVKYVEYEGAYYEIYLVVADIPIWRMEASKRQ